MTDEASSDRPNRLPWPPILYGATVALAAILDRVLPIGDVTGGAVTRAVGVALALAGFAVALSGLLRFRAIGTSFHPSAPATALATSGVYARTRNPMYVGAVVCFLGLALASRSMWLILLVPVMAVALNVLAIEREERYLARRFGADYAAYRARVPRWF